MHKCVPNVLDDTLTPHDLRRVAVLASVDPRSVAAYLAGRRQRSTTAARIAQALREFYSTKVSL